MRFLILALVSLIICASPAWAVKSPLFDTGGPKGANALIAHPSELPKLETAQDYANVYYKNCVRQNTDKNMKEYNDLQCACAAAAMPEVMDLQQIKSLFNPLSDDPYPYTRMMLLAYSPCLQTSLRSLVYDSCIAEPKTQEVMNSGQKVCECIADSMSEFALKYGQYLLPGSRGSAGFDVALGSGDQLGAVIGSKSFQIHNQYYTETCYARRNYGW